MFIVFLFISVLFQTPNWAFAIGLPKDSQLTGIGLGCGGTIYTEEFDPTAVDDLANCYRAGLEAYTKKSYSPMGLAFLSCEKFKNKTQGYECLNQFKKVTQDSDLFTIFTTCDSKAAGNKINNGATEQTNFLYDCLQSEKENGGQNKFILKKTKESAISADDKNFLQFVNETCGLHFDIAAKSEIEGLANCYQIGLLRKETKNKNFIELSLEMCAQFKYNIQKINCLHRTSNYLKEPKIENASKLCLAEEKQIIKTAKSKYKWAFKGKNPWERDEHRFETRFSCLKSQLVSQENSTQTVISTPAKSQKAQP
jgi:hypothetical protein